MNLNFRITAISAIFLIGIFFASCEKDKHIAVTALSLDKQTLYLFVDDSKTLSAAIAPSNASDSEVIWISSNPQVATVENGIVTAVSVGTSTIHAVSKVGDFRDECEVTVVANTTAPGNASITFGDAAWNAGDIKVRENKFGVIGLEFAQKDLNKFPLVIFTSTNTTGTHVFADRINEEKRYCDYFETVAQSNQNLRGEWMAQEGKIEITEFADDKISGRVEMTMYDTREVDDDEESNLPSTRQLLIVFNQLDVE